MATKVPGGVPPLARKLKHEFENAVRDVYQTAIGGKNANYRKPIFRRSGDPNADSKVNAEKRAVADAAKALAQLWKIAPNSR